MNISLNPENILVSRYVKVFLFRKLGVGDSTYQRNILDRWDISSPLFHIRGILEKILHTTRIYF